MIVTPAFHRILTAVEAAEHSVIRGLHEKRIETEPTLTDRFLGAVEIAFDKGLECEGYQIRVRTLRDRGPNAPEAEFGADLASVLHIATKEYRITKGFLAQAKFANKEGIYLNGSGRRYPDISLKLGSASKRMVNQCRQMLLITPESYVFIYSEFGIFVIPASTVVSLVQDGNSYRVNMKTLRWFMEDYLRSFIGDLGLSAYDDNTFRELRDTTFSNYALMVEMSGQSGRNKG